MMDPRLSFQQSSMHEIVRRGGGRLVGYQKTSRTENPKPDAASRHFRKSRIRIYYVYLQKDTMSYARKRMYGACMVCALFSCVCGCICDLNSALVSNDEVVRLISQQIFKLPQNAIGFAKAILINLDCLVIFNL